MKVKFKVPRKIDEHLFTKGVHDVPDKLAKHWYLLALIQNGDASIIEHSKVSKKASQEVAEQKQKPVVEQKQKDLKDKKSKEKKPKDE